MIIMFRLGDFHETFDDDAEIVASVCNIVLTGRDLGTGNRVPLAGVPYHAVETYIAKLIQAGHKVAIVEQQGDPDEGRSLMQREVVRVVTPGTIVEPGLLEEKRGNRRYDLHPAVKQFAEEKLQQSGEQTATRRKHAAYFLALAEKAAPMLTRPEQAVWLEQLEQEHDNFRAAAHCARVAGAQRAAARAVQLLGAAQALRENIRAPLSPMDQRKHDSTISNLCGQMDQAAFASVWSAGRAMTLEQVVAYALEGV